MHLTEQHNIKRHHTLYKLFNDLSKKSKVIYNVSNYIIRQEFIHNKKWIRWTVLDKIIRQNHPDVYSLLPAKSVQGLLKNLDSNWSSFFQAIKSYNKDKSKFKARPKLPKYKDKETGKHLLILNNQQFKFNKNNNLQFLPTITKTIKHKNIKSNIDLTHSKLVELRVIPLKESYTLEIIYEIQDSILKENEGLNYKTGELTNLNSNIFTSIDLGINNFLTVTDNIGKDNVIINGKIIKSINQWTNKFQSFNLSQKKKNKVWKKRDFKLKHYFHQVSNYLIKRNLDKGIKHIIIGNNKEWKQDVNLGKRTNQNFVNIPYLKFINILRYKCQLSNINLIITEESYTSKCSFVDDEPVKKQASYLGKRVKRGLFKSSDGTLINADLNGALNIGKKVFPTGFNYSNGIEGFVVSPYKINFNC